jgi:hypothetical protein
MRHTFQRTEQTLYAQLSRTPVSSLNDVRRSFLSAARGASRRLGAWQGKHLRSVSGGLGVEKLSLNEPEWWDKNCHAVPGSNVIVREDDWGSIIAFTLRYLPTFLLLCSTVISCFQLIGLCERIGVLIAAIADSFTAFFCGI